MRVRATLLAAGLALAVAGPAAATPQQAGEALLAGLRAAGCKLDIPGAEALAQQHGLDSADLATASQLLIASGDAALAEDGTVLTLSAAACAAPASGDAARMAAAASGLAQVEVARLERLGDPGLRGALALAMPALGCTLDLSDPAAAAARAADAVALQGGAAAATTPEGRAALATMLAGVLARPGPAYDRSGDLLTATHCTPS